jgi:hypothetical protein
MLQVCVCDLGQRGLYSVNGVFKKIAIPKAQ